MDDTFLKLATAKKIRITNITPWPAEFEWKTLISEKEKTDKKTYLV